MPDLNAILKEHRSRKSEADERRRLSQDRSNFDEVLSCVEDMIEACTRATLQYLQQPPRKGESIVGMIRRASAIVASHPPQLPSDASVKYLARAVAEQEQNLRDIEYFRQGYGRGSGRPKPHDMRRDSPASVTSGPVNDFGRLFKAFNSLGKPPPLPEVKVDYEAIFDGITERLWARLAPQEFMDSVIDLCHGLAPLEAWDLFRALPYEREVRERSTFILEVIAKEPPAISLAGFYFEIDYPIRNGETVADVSLSADDSYDPDNDEWSLFVKYEPLDAAARSEVLASIYALAQPEDGLGKAADYSICLAWAAYFGRACVQRYREETRADLVGLRVGFHDGDWVDLGWL